MHQKHVDFYLACQFLLILFGEKALCVCFAVVALVMALWWRVNVSC